MEQQNQQENVLSYEARSCIGKVRYPNKYRAIDAAIAMSEKVWEEFDTYECYYCSGWHIGHSLIR